MATYFTEYFDHIQHCGLSDLVEEGAKDYIHAVGGLNGSGLFLKTDDAGVLDWSKSYLLNGFLIGFITGVECDNGDFILYGSQQILPERNRNLVVRVDSSGAVIWAKTYHTDRTRFNIQLVKSVDDTYFMTSWWNEHGSVDDIEVLRINGSGALLQSKVIGTGVDDQVNGMIAYKDGIVIFGTTSDGPVFDNFILNLDRNLAYKWGYFIGDQQFQEIRDIVPVGEDQFVVTGERDPNRDSFIFTFDRALTTYTVTVYDLIPGGPDGGFKRLIRSEDYYYMIGDRYGYGWSFICKLDLQFNLVWYKQLNPKADYILRDIQIHPDDPSTIRLAGTLFGPVNRALVMATNLDLDSCITEVLEPPTPFQIHWDRHDWRPPIDDLRVDVIAVQLGVKVNEVATENPCGDAPFSLQNAYFQSPFVYLQAAGSTAEDDSVYGFHLRWAFQRTLGDKHLAKGNLSGPNGAYPSTANFNRANDFVKVYRGEFKDEFWTIASLSSVPNTLVETGNSRMWGYDNLQPVSTRPSNLNTIELLFADVALYDFIRTLVDPTTNPLDFIHMYSGVIEARVVDKLSFYVRMVVGEVQVGASGFIKLETVSLPDALDPTSTQLACRQDLQNQAANDIPEIVCENIHRIRFSYGNDVAPLELHFLTYPDYMMGVEDKYPPYWTKLGDYGLTDDDNEAYRRLEDTARYALDHVWRKFNEPTPSGEFTVSMANYQDRWSTTQGLKFGVTEYLGLSQTDYTATAILPNNDPMVNTSQMEVSYFDLLNMVSLDFHVARILGLGEIDVHPVWQGKPILAPLYVFLMEYETQVSLEGEPASVVQHLYMTPQLTFYDHKLPPAPALQPVAYGLFSDNLTGNPTPLTDPDGYLPYADVRFINLHKDPFRYELPFESFFLTNDEFCLCDETLPLSFGVEYAAGTIGTGSYVRPELINDASYQDPGGLNEVVPLAETGVNPIFVHQETQSGIHHYGLYSINWFSRVSPVGNEVETDFTQFPLRCPLRPPLNLQAQLIQTESALIFTTQVEQNMLNGIGGSDKTLMRVTFDWNYVHNTAYQFADRVRLFFRMDPPLVVKGKIATGSGSVVIDSVTHLVTIQTTSYLISSVLPAVTVVPTIPLADKPKFIGSTLVANGVAFVIEDINTTVGGVNPEFVLRQTRETHSQESPANSNIWYTTETWTNPNAGDMFFVYENLSPSSAWDQVLTKEITVVNFTPTYTETVVHPDGNVLVQQIGGLTDTATVEHVYDPDPNAQADTPTGVYNIEFDTEDLTPHPDTDVEFYRGIVRIAGGSGEMKELQVWAIDNSGTTLKLTVYDPDFEADPIIPATPDTQTGIAVNFHPSYRAYFTVDGNFNATNILPGFNEGTRLTYIDAVSLDTSCGCESHLAPPAVLLAREIREPVAPGIPSGPLFATRPNFYGKATYTFDVEVDQPYSLIFYRANERKILDTLYKPETVALILDELAALTSPDADFFQDRWRDFVNMVLDTGNNFKEYVTGGWRFMQPDNPKYKIPHPHPSVNALPFNSGLTLNDNFTYFDTITGSNVTLSMIDVVKDAIDGAFLPLTEIPAVYSQIHDDVFVTSGRAPLLRNANGQLLVYPSNDPWPMAIRYEKDGGGNILQYLDTGYGSGTNTRWVRFTDFTLDGEAQNFYFYFAVELSNTLQVSERSDVAGPIQLVNSGAAKPPRIKRIITQLKNTHNQTPTAVRFELNEIVASENIKKLQVLRANSMELALSARTMDVATVIDFGDEIVDYFTDMPFAPYGDLLAYRIVALREIMNEQGLVEYVPSEPSNVAITNIVDYVNPPAPKVTYAAGSPTGSPLQLPGVLLSWEQTAYNATYYVYKQGDTGNWQLIKTVKPVDHLNTPMVTLDLASTTLGTNTLFKETSELLPLYHRFRVDAENSSGLLNLDKKEITI